MKAVGYIRVSTQGQVDDGISLESQRAKIQSWCHANDYELVQIHEDAGVSGARIANRTGLQLALEATQKGMALVTYSISRLARSTKDMLEIAETLERRGADLVSLTERIDTTSAAGRMVFRMLAVLSEFERDLVGERTKAALNHKRQIGEKYGVVPFGFVEAAGRLIADQDETKVIKDAIRQRTRGATYRQIAASLNEKGIVGKNGGKWHASTVRYILNRQAVLY